MIETVKWRIAHGCRYCMLLNNEKLCKSLFFERQQKLILFLMTNETQLDLLNFLLFLFF